jgi:hypothetical protein
MREASIVFLLIALFKLGAYSQQNDIFKAKTGNEEPYYKNEWHFGLSLATSSSGGMVRLGWIKIHEDGRQEIQWLTQRNFVMQASGQQPSRANPDRVNYFEKYQIRWDVFDILWKLRYSEWPYDDERRQEQGWSGKMFVPSDAQWEYLGRNYGYSALSDFLHGENMWKLLQDVQDGNWVSQYSSLK